MRRVNPIRHTVKHFIGSEMRELRKISRDRLTKKHPQKSNFVRFLESLQNRSGQLSVSETLYEKWTKEVRDQMEKAGTWPKPDQETNLKILAEYLSRLFALFWNRFPDLDRDDVETLLYNRKSSIERSHQEREVVKKIYNKIRQKGIRDKAYEMENWLSWTPCYSWIRKYYSYKEKDRYSIAPHKAPYDHRTFNDHGAGI